MEPPLGKDFPRGPDLMKGDLLISGGLAVIFQLLVKEPLHHAFRGFLSVNEFGIMYLYVIHLLESCRELNEVSLTTNIIIKAFNYLLYLKDLNSCNFLSTITHSN